MLGRNALSKNDGLLRNRAHLCLGTHRICNKIESFLHAKVASVFRYIESEPKTLGTHRIWTKIASCLHGKGRCRQCKNLGRTCYQICLYIRCGGGWGVRVGGGGGDFPSVHGRRRSGWTQLGMGSILWFCRMHIRRGIHPDIHESGN